MKTLTLLFLGGSLIGQVVKGPGTFIGSQNFTGATVTGISGTGGVNCLDAAGSGANYTCPSASPAPSAYAAGLIINFTPGTTSTCTSACQLNVAGLGNRAVKDATGGSPTVGAFVSGTTYVLVDNGTLFRAVGGVGGGGSGGTSAYTTTSFSATPTFTVTASTNVQNFFITLTGNVTSSTLQTTGATTGQDIAFNICQDGTGSRTFVWPTNVTGASTIVGTLSTCSRQVFRFDGTNAIAITPLICPACGPGLGIPGSSSGQTTVLAPATGGGTATFFAGTDTIAGRTVANGGTGASTLTGVLKGNGTSAISVVTGTATDCVLVNGTSGTCGSGGSSITGAHPTFTQGSNITLTGTSDQAVQVAASIPCTQVWGVLKLTLTTGFTGGTGSLFARWQHGSTDLTERFQMDATTGTVYVTTNPGVCARGTSADLNLTFNGNGVNSMAGFTVGVVVAEWAGYVIP